MRLMFDAAFPPATAPQGFDAVAGYVGGDTLHVWTPQEWARFARLGKLPIWTRSNPSQADPYADAVAFDRALQALGVPAGAPVALDKETTSDPVYLRHFALGLSVARYELLVQYESLSAYNAAQGAGLAVSSEFWVADWTGQPHMLPKPVYILQWASAGMLATNYDASLIRWDLYERLWI